MPKWLDSWLNKKILELGYTKARRRKPRLDVLFAGESPIAPELYTTQADLTQVEREIMAVTSSWVYADISEIVKAGSKASAGIYEREGEEVTEVVNHEFEQLMVQPNPHFSGTFMKQYTLWWWLLRGEAYWLKVFDLSGTLTQLWPIPSPRIRPIPDKKKYISGYRYTPKHGQKGVTFLPRQICFFRFPNPFDYHRGLAPLSAYWRALQTDTKAADWNLGTFDNEVTLKMLLSLRPELSQPQFEQAKADILDQLIEKQKRFMIARAGDVTPTQFSMSPREIEFFRGREMSRTEIDRVFGFPEGYWSVQANRANAEAAKATLIDNTIWPLLVLMAEDITAQIIIPEYGENLLAQFEDIRIQDRRLLMAEHKVNWTVTTLDEAREDLDMEAYEGPLAEAIGQLPVPLATNPQFVLALGGLAIAGPMGQGGGLPPPSPERKETPQSSPPPKQEQEQGEEVQEEEVPPEEPTPTEQKAFRDDLRRWRGVALRRLRAGEDPATYDFESYAIPAQLAASIKAQLIEADEEDVKLIFTSASMRSAGGEVMAAQSAGFQWQGYG